MQRPRASASLVRLLTDIHRACADLERRFPATTPSEPAASEAPTTGEGGADASTAAPTAAPTAALTSAPPAAVAPMPTIAQVNLSHNLFIFA